MTLSRFQPSPSSPADQAMSLPAASRFMPMIGCATSSGSRPFSDNSPRTESRRKGMSSLTISTTETVCAVAPEEGEKKPDFRRMRRTLDDPLPRLGGEIGELRRIVLRYVFRRRAREKLPDERRLCVARAAGQKLLGGGEELVRSVVLRDR